MAHGGPDEAGDAISDHVHEGEAIIVQVLADAREGKGAKLTRRIKMVGEQLVYSPLEAGARVSARINDKSERARLKAIGESLIEGVGLGGVVVRSAAEGAALDSLSAELDTLKARWLELKKTAGTAKPPQRLSLKAGALSRYLARYLEQAGRGGIARMVSDGHVDNGEHGAEKHVEKHAAREDIFRAFAVEDEIASLLNPRVALPSGGSLIIEETAALVAMDVNAGGGAEGASGKGEALALKTNLEAVHEAARQIRLRNLAGLIAIDTMPMRTKDNEKKVLGALKVALGEDPLHPRLHGLTSAGLIEVTRPRRRPPLSHLLLGPCSTCTTGRAPTALSTGLAALERVLAEVAARPGLLPALVAHPDVVRALKAEAPGALDEMETRLGQPLELIGDGAMASGQFRVDASQR